MNYGSEIAYRGQRYRALDWRPHVSRAGSVGILHLFVAGCRKCGGEVSIFATENAVKSGKVRRDCKGCGK